MADELEPLRGRMLPDLVEGEIERIDARRDRRRFDLRTKHLGGADAHPR
jgi:hypothetical protein